jgi:hypothetical protein
MKTTSILLATILLFLNSLAQTEPAPSKPFIDSISQRVFLIGDAGELINGAHPVVDWLKKNVDWNDTRNTAVFLGDNIYPYGLPMEGEPTYTESKKILDAQLSLVKGKKGRAFFVQGNHDWKNGKLGGWQQVMNQINYINGQDQENLIAEPRDGCPGPVSFDLSEKVVLVTMDSQWFLYVHEKPGPGSNCSSRTLEEFATELREILATHQNQLVILAMHHPMYSYGVHGGDYSWKEHLFPLTALNKNLWIPMPILGSVYPITRGVFGNIQDVKHPLYQTMVNTIESVIKEHPNVIPVAGHDHSLQLIVKDSINYIVSGSGSNLSRVHDSKQGRLLFRDLNFGFSVLDVYKSGRVETRFYNIQSKDMASPTFKTDLKKIDTLPTFVSRDSIPFLPDSIMVVPNPDLVGSGLRHFFMGKNYRKEWTTPIKVEVLNLGTELGGLTPEKQGGGKQTKSLRVHDKNGKEWALRSVQKFPEAAIPADLRSGFARDIVEDGISASYPFASLSTMSMAQAVGVPTLKRRLVYIPDDPRLGRFRPSFKNTLAILEEREPEGVKKTYNTDELYLRLLKDNDDHVDQVSVLKARLLDNFYMDLDRHEDQWRWATRDTGKGKIYWVIPRDQDQAFYVNQGVLPYFVKKPWFIPELQGFQANADNINTFNKPARNFDRYFLNDIDEQEWKAQVDTLLTKMTDGVIESALRRQPPEIQGFHTEKIINTLKKRKKYFMGDMMQYYRFISKDVSVVGTNQRELFTIDKQEGGRIHVTVNKIDKEGVISSKIYDRVLDPKITQELRVFGLESADSFVVRGGDSKIRVRIIGGSGKDAFLNEGNGGKVLVYDVTFEENKFYGNETGLRKKVSSDPQANMYTRGYFKYNFANPGLSVGYNIDDGVSLGYGVVVTRQGFRREPYAQRHVLAARRALRTSSLYFHYSSEFIKAIGNTDLLLRADVRAPINVTNFFGIGNDTRFDKNHANREQFYRSRYNMINVSAMGRRQMQSWMRFNFGAAFQYFKLNPEENLGRFVSEAPANGLDPETLYDPKLYVGPQVLLDINSKNNAALPSRGFVLDAGARSLFGLHERNNNVTQLHMDMRIYASFESKAKLVYGIRFGAGHNIGKYEFQQAQYLSGTENVRGYRRNRFAGRTMFYNNLEVRLKLADIKTYLFPGAFGLLVFNDVGRVWADGEQSTDWHVGNGGGIWIAPVKRFVIAAMLTRSKEEKALPLVTFGFQF